ncbi:MAG: aconitate hydratase AcnA [Pseudomonadota bacterium]
MTALEKSLKEMVIGGERFGYRSLLDATESSLPELPYALRILAENALSPDADPGDLRRILERDGAAIGFRPSRLILQDMLALPLLLDLMLLRETVQAKSAAKSDMQLTLPVDLVIDHSMTIEKWASPEALAENQRREFEVNRERFAFFKACEVEFDNLRVIPPGGGIMHQVNLEYLAGVTETVADQAGPILRADTVLGTDSHTPMVNGLGVLGWGIGGLDAERIALGHRLTMNVPEVVGMHLQGSLSPTATATDIALTAARLLREAGVVGAFVELCGDGYENLSVPDRATIANMAPEYGATCVYCPIDAATLEYLRMTGRPAAKIAQVEAWAHHQRLWRNSRQADQIAYDRVINLDLEGVGRSVAAPSRPEQSMPLEKVSDAIAEERGIRFPVRPGEFDIGHNDVVIAAITSCTNTANPKNMITAGLLARNAVQRGLRCKPWVKTTLSPGSRAVASYLRDSGLQAALDTLGFHIAGFACTTCNGMSGPLDPDIDRTIREKDIKAVAVLSGNRNFAGRIHPLAAKNVLAAPPLIVAYALLGSVDADLETTPLGADSDGNAVTLNDLWPDPLEVDAILDQFAGPETYRGVYRDVARVSDQWTKLNAAGGFTWPEGSTYITRPPFLDDMPDKVAPLRDITGMRALVVLGDAITTDHISPSGYIPTDSAAGQFLLDRSVPEQDFNSFGTRRGSNDIVLRSTFSSIRLRNELVPGKEGSWTRIFPQDRQVPIFEAIKHYKSQNTPLLIVAGKSYGAGSSRDTAAKAPKLAGVAAVIAESYERIHRSNLINMGIAPLLFVNGESRHTIELKGPESLDLIFDLELVGATLIVRHADGTQSRFTLALALTNDAERQTLRHGGALQQAVRNALQVRIGTDDQVSG